MEKTLTLIHEINSEANDIQQLIKQLQQKHQVMQALLISAKVLVPEERWDAWIEANLNVDFPTAQSVLEDEYPSIPRFLGHDRQNLSLPDNSDESKPAKKKAKATKTNGKQ